MDFVPVIIQKNFFGRIYNSINAKYMMHAFVDFSQTLSSRHIKMRINLPSLESICIINYGLESAGFKFNCLVSLYKSVVSYRKRGINWKDDLGLMSPECDILPPTYLIIFLGGLIKAILYSFQ